jgi:hypothetical protein
MNGEKYCYLCGIIIVSFVVGFLAGWYLTKKNIEIDRRDMMTEYMHHRERMKERNSRIKSQTNPEKNKLTHKEGRVEEGPEAVADHDVGVLNHHLGARGKDPEGSNFAHWRDIHESSDNIWWQ